MRVAIESLTVKLGGRTVLHDLNLSIPPGASTAIVGASGAGKTTLLRCVAGLQRPTDGQVLVDGQDPRSLYGNGTVAYLFQEACLWRHLTARSTLQLAFKIYGRCPEGGEIERLLARVGLSGFPDYYPHQMSVGMKARLAIARAFCINPKLLLMDEPFAALDPIRRMDLNRQIAEMHHQVGCTIVWVTHDVVEAIQFATHIIALPHNLETAHLIDLSNLPPVQDAACLPMEALRIRDYLFSLIIGSASPANAISMEAVR